MEVKSPLILHFDARFIEQGPGEAGLGAVIGEIGKPLRARRSAKQMARDSTEAEYKAAMMALDLLEDWRSVTGDKRSFVLIGDSRSVVDGICGLVSQADTNNYIDWQIKIGQRMSDLGGKATWVRRDANRIADLAAEMGSLLALGEIQDGIEAMAGQSPFINGSAPQIQEIASDPLAVRVALAMGRLNILEGGLRIQTLVEAPMSRRYIKSLQEPEDVLSKLDNQTWTLVRNALIPERYRTRLRATIAHHNLPQENNLAEQIATETEKWMLRGLPAGIALAYSLTRHNIKLLGNCIYNAPRRLPLMAEEMDTWLPPTGETMSSVSL